LGANKLPGASSHIDRFVRDLPDPKRARLFYQNLTESHPRFAKTLNADPGLLSDLLALATWSPLLATTLQQHPEYIPWLARVRTDAHLRTREVLQESLGRFGLTNSSIDSQVLLSRFRRRELLRIYLNDIRRPNTLVETMEELSNLADAILGHALTIAQQEMDNRYGQPQTTDTRGRVARATFCVVGLGKLGSFELNYASDIDLMFLYSEDGVTSGNGTRGEISNREYFVKLAESVTAMVGQPSGEGAAYRVDLRLRPHGRNGTLASSLSEAVKYYSGPAQQWELQALIRARETAGSVELFTRFADQVRGLVFSSDISVREALENVRRSKQKIDLRQAGEAGGFNVKLGSGGIREIEFIVQALQLANGGRDEWLRTPHTLVSIGRLGERGLITDAERVELFEAYLYLRKLEHRLQMEHGLQTHIVPNDPVPRKLAALRMDFYGRNALRDFNLELKRHTRNVRSVFERVFGSGIEREDEPRAARRLVERTVVRQPVEATAVFQQPVSSGSNAARFSAHVIAKHFDERSVEELESLILDTANDSLNARRALTMLARVASSLAKETAWPKVTENGLQRLVKFCGTSEPFGEMLAANPSLVSVITEFEPAAINKDYARLLRESVKNCDSFGAELGALRREWAQLMVEIGISDAEGVVSMRESNQLQSKLASASIDVAMEIAEREVGRRFGELKVRPRTAVLGLGRLGGGGMDFGSDLDLVLVYDDQTASPIDNLGMGEACALFAELFVSTLSSMTRDGYLYRVDLRLRPDGRNGPTCSGALSFTEYLKTRSAPWEWLAYVKLRAAAGDSEFGQRIEGDARRIVHELAKAFDPVLLKQETKKIRERLRTEKTRKNSLEVDIKYGSGGMLDVYFATRFLQLRDNVPDQADDRSTVAVLGQLFSAGSLEQQDYDALKDGYQLLRRVDHAQRLTIGRTTRLPGEDHPAFGDIALRAGFESKDEFLVLLKESMTRIKAAYERILA
jgi:glutamate-ammonia-ligase adenylyltransferase